MKRHHFFCRIFSLFVLGLLIAFQIKGMNAQSPPSLIPKFALQESGLKLERHTESGAFYDVTGRRSAVFGYENRASEAWVYPLKILDDFNLSFQLEGYPLEISASDIAAHIDVRPEATIFTYSHSAFTARQIIFTPVDEPGIIMLLDVQSVLPVKVTWSFRPRLRLMWPAGSMTSNLSWVENERVYHITEETNRYVGIVGSPSARDISVMPYQEEPRDVPVKFVVESSVDAMHAQFIPIIITGSVEGLAPAKATYNRLLKSIQPLYEKNVDYYRKFLAETVNVQTPDKRLDEAFQWAKIGVEKGVTTNPFLGTGLVAGFRTSGESERPGFGWFFGRDALWTTLAINSYGDFATTRTALNFLKKFQRADGKIPHEISQSASLIDWFNKYPYPWASTDATPLYVIAHADYWQASGDAELIRANWESIVKAYRFSEATDTDQNGLIENTKFGHGWVEGGALSPPHEEIYLQGLWIEASRNMAQLASLMGDTALAESARANAERTRLAMEQTYWLSERNFYAFATSLPRTTEPIAEPGPYRTIRQARLNEMRQARLIDEDTVLPAVPLWWHTMENEHAQAEIDHLGSGNIATDWGARLLSNQSKLYDPLSYHYGSVWPLFTGWAAMGAYSYGRPHVGYQALMANSLLTFQGALGYITELLSGDFNAAFGRSSHHQIWSEAMVVTPAMRGLCGLQASDGGKSIKFAPQLPINWEHLEVKNYVTGGARFDFSLKKSSGQMSVKIDTHSLSGNLAPQLVRMRFAPAFPLDAQIRRVTVNGRPAKFDIVREGDIQRAEVLFDLSGAHKEIFIYCDEGTDVYPDYEEALSGAGNQGLRILRSRAAEGNLHLMLEGLGGRRYALRIRSPFRIGEAPGVTVSALNGTDRQLLIDFDGAPDQYVRKEVSLPLSGQTPSTKPSTRQKKIP